MSVVLWCNEVQFFLIRSSRNPDSLHPYGFSRERYAYALVSGVAIFFLGGGVSLYHGVIGLLTPTLAQNLHYAFLVLGGSVIFEGYTAFVAFRQVKKAALESEMSIREYST